MIEKIINSYWVKIYLSGPIDIAKQIIREECMREGLCVTVETTTFIYTGGEERGCIIGLINYPKLPLEEDYLWNRGLDLARKVLDGTFQNSVLVVSPKQTLWLSKGIK